MEEWKKKSISVDFRKNLEDLPVGKSEEVDDRGRGERDMQSAETVAFGAHYSSTTPLSEAKLK